MGVLAVHMGTGWGMELVYKDATEKKKVGEIDIVMIPHIIEDPDLVVVREETVENNVGPEEESVRPFSYAERADRFYVKRGGLEMGIFLHRGLEPLQQATVVEMVVIDEDNGGALPIRLGKREKAKEFGTRPVVFLDPMDHERRVLGLQRLDLGLVHHVSPQPHRVHPRDMQYYHGGCHGLMKEGFERLVDVS